MKMLTIVCLILTIICSTYNISNADNEAIFDMQTGNLNIPKVLLMSDTYEVDLLLTAQGFTIKDVKPNNITDTASGKFLYDQNTEKISVDFVESTFIEDGPQPGKLSIALISLTDAQLVFSYPSGDRTTWERILGAGQTLIGQWQENNSDQSSKTIMTFGEDGDVTYTKQYLNFMVRDRQIKIDGDYSDWSEQDKIVSDGDSPECDNLPGRDLKDVYIAKDKIFIYLRFVTNGQLDSSSQYLFGNEDLHMRVYQDKGVFKVSYSSGSGITPSSIVLPDTYIHVTENQFEAKLFNLETWTNKTVYAWVDQGRETVCRDNISLPILLME